jgi:hypothetical protein
MNNEHCGMFLLCNRIRMTGCTAFSITITQCSLLCTALYHEYDKISSI